MERMRSILWVGGAERLREERVAEAPLLDVAWARDAGDAAELPLRAFDALVVDCDSGSSARESVVRLRAASAPGGPPIVVRLPEADDEIVRALRDAGAAAVGARTRGGIAALLASLAPRAGGVGRPQHAAARDPRTDDRGPVARSRAMRAVLALAERAMRSRATVLVTGETGTGKELLARAIHEGGARRDGPFVAVNCAAFPDTLLESELFGHGRGAFTGADRDRKGLFEEAAGGTLFLDEVGETSPSLQAKLLRALQEREIRVLGTSRARRVDVRVVAATNRDLRAEVEAGRFRDDLYWRLAVFHLVVPPLRERREDVLPLARHFLCRHAADPRRAPELAPDAADLLTLYPWPGNVRELENEMQRALALLEPGEGLAARHLSDRLNEALRPAREAGVAPGGPETLRVQMARLEAWLLRRALDAHGGRRAATARTLGITREGLYKKMRRFGIG
jgi:DNA-binding NtrC family response regulator